jgi:hypothetical protein
VPHGKVLWVALVALLLGMPVISPAEATSTDGKRLGGFSIRSDGSAAGRWMGSYKYGKAGVYRIDPNATAALGTWSAPTRRAHLAGISDRALRRAAWVLSRYGPPLDNPDDRNAQGAAVDAAVYALLRPQQLGLATNWAQRRLAETTHATSVSGLARWMIDRSATDSGPYRVSISAPNSMRVNTTANATVTVRSRSGTPISGLPVSVQFGGVRVSGDTDNQGEVPVNLIPAQAGFTQLRVTVAKVPEWRVFLMTPRQAGHSRVLLAGRKTTAKAAKRIAVIAAPRLTGLTGTTEVVGTNFPMSFLVSNGYPTTRLATATLYGPWQTSAQADAASCSGSSVATQSVAVKGNGSYQISQDGLSTPGHYRWRIALVGNDLNRGTTSGCGAATWLGLLPTVEVSAPSGLPFDTRLRSNATISGLPSPYSGSLTGRLYGPFDSRDGVSCTLVKESDSVEVSVTTNGARTLPALTTPRGGFYGLKAQLSPSNLSFASNSPCNTIARKARPSIPQLGASPRIARVGDNLGLNWTLAESAATSRPANIRLFGPWLSAAAADSAGCDPDVIALSGSITVTGNGQYKSPLMKSLAEGYYNWGVQVTGDEVNLHVPWTCGAPTKVKTAPTVAANASRESVRPNTKVTARLRVSQLPSDYSGRVFGSLYGPYAAPDNAGCGDLKRVDTVSVPITDDGTYTSPPVQVKAPGWYTWLGIVPATDLSDRAESRCGGRVATVHVTRGGN